MTQEMTSAELPIDTISKPTRRLRLILGLYSGFVGLISIFLIPIGWFYYTLGSIELLELELNLPNITLVSINIVIGYVLLPRFMSQGRYNPSKAILGGAITFVIAQFIRSLIAGYLMSNTKDFLIITQLSFLFETLLPLFTFALVIAVVLGGGAAWLINKLLHSNPALFGVTHTSLRIEPPLTQTITTYVPSNLNPRKTTRTFRFFSASYCALIGGIVPLIAMALFYLVQEKERFNPKTDIGIELLVLVPGCFLLGYFFVPRYTALLEYRPRRSFFIGASTLGLTCLITGFLFLLYSVPVEEIFSQVNSEFDMFLYWNFPILTTIFLSISVFGGLTTWLGYRLLFNRTTTRQPGGLSVFD